MDVVFVLSVSKLQVFYFMKPPSRPFFKNEPVQSKSHGFREGECWVFQMFDSNPLILKNFSKVLKNLQIFWMYCFSFYCTQHVVYPQLLKCLCNLFMWTDFLDESLFLPVCIMSFFVLNSWHSQGIKDIMVHLAVHHGQNFVNPSSWNLFATWEENQRNVQKHQINFWLFWISILDEYNWVFPKIGVPQNGWWK